MMKYVESSDGYSHSVGYEYDTLNNLTKLVESINGVDRTTTYTYDDDNRIKTSTTDGVTVEYDYDDFGRVETQTTKNGSTVILTESYTYKAPTSTTTSAQVATYTTTTPNGYSVTYSYTYDDNGNITSISDGTNTTTYHYDSANQLYREDNQAGNHTNTWTYDNGGNILNRKEYAYTTGELKTLYINANYTYGDSQWGDLLTAFFGYPITYDQIGNPLNDGIWDYTWEHGRQLVRMYDGVDMCTYTYDANGMRTSKTVNADTYNYVYNGSQLTQMTKGADTLYFSYDASGTPLSVTYNGTVYYYITNLQGDVIAILNSAGTAVATYAYDAWGNIYSIGGTMVSTLGALNPLRYRGYVYDTETALYYLQSRYYNPDLGRFINADAFAATGQGLLGNNMFAYCGNNPVLNIDAQGTRYCEATTIQGESSVGRSIACQHQNNMNRNVENVMHFFGVASVTDIPKIPDNAMLFLENISSVTIGGISYIHGSTIVMDNNKYCEYLFNGVGYGVSGVPFDYCETVGYVYGVSDISDFEGWFYGGSFNQLSHISGGAIAPNGVYSEILSGNGFISSSLGGSITYYSTPQNGWKYGKANINWHTPVYYSIQWDCGSI